MNWLNLLGMAVGLAMDALAVAIVAGMTVARVTPRHTFRIAFHFGLFQFLMPVLGWAAGRRLAGALVDYDHWIVFGLLALIGGKMLYEAGQNAEINGRSDPTRGWMLVTLSIATSIDALAVGLSMALLDDGSIWFSAVVIGMVAAAFSAVGITFGSRLGARWSHWSEIVGGVILILIGGKVLLSHLLAG
ncbi:MAG: manganese efflux pump [Pirellulales bacterium]|nr:manganese efflux pump [Pirellulales bacterium]